MDAQTLNTDPAFATKSGLPLLENKAAQPEGGPVRSALDELAAAFAAFKETNDARIDQIEGRLGADVLTEEKLARIDAALDAARTRNLSLVLVLHVFRDLLSDFGNWKHFTGHAVICFSLSEEKWSKF